MRRRSRRGVRLPGTKRRKEEKESEEKRADMGSRSFPRQTRSVIKRENERAGEGTDVRMCEIMRKRVQNWETGSRRSRTFRGRAIARSHAPPSVYVTLLFSGTNENQIR